MASGDFLHNIQYTGSISLTYGLNPSNSGFSLLK